MYFGEGDKRNVGKRVPGPTQTNNRAELLAAIESLRVIRKEDVDARSKNYL